MHKHSMLFTMLATAGIMASAAVLTPEAAYQRAISNGVHKVAPANDETPKLLYITYTTDQQPSCYIFSGADGEGFIVLSADDTAAPMLAYSETGKFEADRMPADMKYMLDLYGKEMQWARTASVPAYKVQSRADKAAIAPLLKTNWDQSAPYNDLCPEQSNRHSATGCVATAMAQTLKHFNYPPKGEGSNNYYCESLNRTIITNFADYTFAWDKMLDRYDTSSNADQRLAVAELMYTCGTSVNMQYSPSTSSSSTRFVAKAFIENFSIDKNCHALLREYKTYNEWNDIIYEELKNNRPVIMGGQTINDYEGGHCFVLDGYDGKGYFHVNWGWGGMSDGYFRLTGMDPSSQGIGGASAGFNVEQTIIVGTQKPQPGSEYYLEILAGANFTISQKSVTLGRSIEISFEGRYGSNMIYNACATTVYGTVGINIISSNGTKRYVAGAALGSEGLVPNQGIGKYNVTIPSDLAAGTYTIVPAWTSSDYVNRDIPVRIDDRGSYQLTVSGNSGTLTAIDVNAKISVTDVKDLTPVYVGTRARFSAKVTNTSDFEYFNTLAAGLFKEGAAQNAKPEYAGDYTFVDVEKGQTIDIDYTTSFGKAAAGTYDMYFYNPNTNERYSEAHKITIEAAPKQRKLNVTNFGLKDGSKEMTDKYNLQFVFDIECTEGIIDSPLMIGITQGTSSVWRTNFKTPSIFLFAGESETVEAFGTFSSAQLGKTYNAYLYNGLTQSSPKLAGPFTFTFVDPTGITDVEFDAEVVKSELYNLQGIKVDAESAPHGHYIRVNTYTDGTTESEHVIIK